MRLIPVDYLGFAAMDRRFSSPMMPWIMAEIKMRGMREKMLLSIGDGYIKGYSGIDPDSVLLMGASSEPLFQHSIHYVKKYSNMFGNHCTFLYIMSDPTEPSLLFCYLYQTEEPNDVMELFTSMREQMRDGSPAISGAGRSLSNASKLTSLCADISPSSSHFFEVLYIGKIKVSHRKVPDTFIDDALEKFRLHDLEKEKLRLSGNVGKVLLMRNNSNSRILPVLVPTSVGKDLGERRGSQDSSCGGSDLGSAENISSPDVEKDRVVPVPTSPIPAIALTGSLETLSSVPAPPEITTAEDIEGVTKSTSAEQGWGKQTSLPLEPMRVRAGSAGSALIKKPDAPVAEHNRTMLFLVGRSDLRLISPDRKQVLLHKNLRDIASCIQGVRHSDHFGFICREQNADNFIGYVFKCQSESFADDVVGAINQAFLATTEAYKKEKQPVLSCEHCPMMWYHKLCSELEGLNEKRAQQAIFRRLELLPEEEQATLLTKFQGSDNSSHSRGLHEQNEFLMMLIRAHCESKQARHVHDTAENRSEFLNQYLGGSTIFMKAKRSLTSSFDHLLKRRGSRDDFAPITKELSLPMNAALCKDSSPPNRASPSLELPDHDDGSADSHRPRASTVGAFADQARKEAVGQNGVGVPPGSPGASQKGREMMNIFLKVGSTPKSSPTSSDTAENDDVRRHSGSWRQAIFKTVVTPSKSLPGEIGGSPDKPVKKTKEELRSLWKKAINQQVLLIRMEKENARLRARQEEADVKRIKLEYDEIGSCMREVMEVWDLLISKESRFNARCDNQMLLQAIRQGVPRTKRGDVWHFLAEQYCLKIPPIDTSNFPNYNVPYEDLLKQLTSHQHAILIDLGRTFPNHMYYSSSLGPGQLALFNLLKAYSLLDPEVGYCQGLSFVAGVLLLHMAEDTAFFLLRHLMFRRGLRRQYLPDMAALQVQLYQLSRLLHDQCPELYAHFDKHEVAPTLYAAPWMLTLFASQFPLGFVTRVFDLMFVESPEIVFRVAISLLFEHKEGLLRCGSFEEIMDYLKGKVPNVDRLQLDRIMKQVFNMDITKQLHEYEVEYHVLQEELSSPRAETEKIRQLQEENKQLQQQIEIATSNMHRLETTRTLQQGHLNRLESQVRSLEVSVSTLGGFIATLIDNHRDIEIPGEVRRLVSQLSAPGPDRRKNSGNLGLGNILKPRVDSMSVNKQTIDPSRHEPMTRTKSDPPREIPSPRSYPLKVIEDDERYEGSVRHQLSLQNGSTINSMRSKGSPGKSATPYPLKSALSSPNLTAKVSSLFQSKHQTEQRMNNRNQNGLDKQLDSKNTVIIEDFHESRATSEEHSGHGSFVDIPLQTSGEKISKDVPFKENNQPLRRAEIMKQLQAIQKHDTNFKLDIQHREINRPENSVACDSSKENEHPEKNSIAPISAIDSKDKTENIEVVPSAPTLHPLDSCSDISFSYGGTTKLKTIRPLRAQLSRNATIASFGSNSLPKINSLSSSPEPTSSAPVETVPNAQTVLPSKKELLSS